MLKVRLRGTKKDLELAEKDLKKIARIHHSSEIYKDKKSEYFRKYLEVELGKK